MRSVTLAQAALFAALAMALLTGYQLIDNVALIRDTPALVLLGSTVPGVVWAGFFFVLYRNPSSVRTAARAAARTSAWITLVFAVLLEAVVVYIRFHRAVNYWTPFGNALNLFGWLLRLGWAVFLIAFALSPDSSRTRSIALLLAILSAPSALSSAFGAFNSGIGFLFGDIPMQAMWRALITPVIRTIYWLSQILFLWTLWGKSPETRSR